MNLTLMKNTSILDLNSLDFVSILKIDFSKNIVVILTRKIIKVYSLFLGLVCEDGNLGNKKRNSEIEKWMWN